MYSFTQVLALYSREPKMSTRSLNICHVLPKYKTNKRKKFADFMIVCEADTITSLSTFHFSLYQRISFTNAAQGDIIPLFWFTRIGLKQQVSACGLSLRTSDRCHWCGNPYSQQPAWISELFSASGGRIATSPVCALVPRNDGRKLSEADTHIMVYERGARHVPAACGRDPTGLA